MTKNLILAAIAGLTCYISTVTSAVENLGPMSDLLDCVAHAVWVLWILHGVFLLVRRAAYRDLG